MKLCSLQSAASFHLTMQGGAFWGKVIPMAPGCCQEMDFLRAIWGLRPGQGRGKVGQLMLWVLSPELPDLSSLISPTF